MAEELATQNIEALRGPFEHKDKPIVEAVARCMGDSTILGLNTVLWAGNVAAVRARRMLQSKIDEGVAIMNPSVWLMGTVA